MDMHQCAQDYQGVAGKKRFAEEAAAMRNANPLAEEPEDCDEEREIPRELLRQYQAAHTLLDAISDLESRLSPALRSSEPRPETEAKEPGVDTEVAARARETRWVIDQCISRVRDMTDRLGI